MIPIAIIQDNKQFASELPGILETCLDFFITQTYYLMEDILPGLKENRADIVIVDIQSADNPGINRMKEIKNETGIGKWMVYTIHDDDESIFDALRAGANGYILKNEGPGQLENALHELLRGGTPMSPSVIKKILTYFHHLPGREDPVGLLSHREKEVLHFTSRGLLYKEIAQRLGIQRETVKKHLSKIYGKLHVQNKIEALNKFYGQ